MSRLILLCALFLSGCAERINGHEFIAIKEFCKDHSGVDYINLVIASSVVCRDGSVKSISRLRKK